ncbi:hypothetical protein Q1695_001857 [Nippostrongylus brasiliensis]|nr:hypothetical protein Q1695_001857 [Nippostrongylus brasiliensis]
MMTNRDAEDVTKPSEVSAILIRSSTYQGLYLYCGVHLLNHVLVIAMYSLFSSCLLQCCPGGVPLFTPILRSGRPRDDDEYEKYEPRPRIVIDKRDASSID